MGKYFVPSEAHTSAVKVREMLDDAEKLVVRMRKVGPQVLTLLHLLDGILDALLEIAETGIDLRPEQSRFQTVQRRLDGQKARFLAEAGEAFQEERSALQPDRERWWWFLDEMLAEQRKRRLRKALTTAGIVAGVLVIMALAYELFLAPPPEVREAYRLESAGENLAIDGDLRGALVEFEKAAEVLPDQGDHWIWIGVLNDALDEPDEAEEAFERARPLFESEYEYLLQRAQAYSRVGDVDAALVDADQAIAINLDSGTGYYVRHSVHIAREDYASAYTDLEQAAALAHESGDVQLEATARVQLAMLIQQMSAAPMPTEEPAED